MRLLGCQCGVCDHGVRQFLRQEQLGTGSEMCSRSFKLSSYVKKDKLTAKPETFQVPLFTSNDVHTVHTGVYHATQNYKAPPSLLHQ